MRVQSIRSLSLRANISWTFIANAVYAGCQWGMLVVLARLGTPADVGRFALGIAVCTPIFMLANLQLRSIQATDAREVYTFGDYLALRLATTALALLACAAVAFAGGHQLPAAMVMLGVALNRAFESLSDLVYGLLQHHERLDRVAISTMLRGPLALTALGAGVGLTGSAGWGCAGWALASAAVLAGYDMPWAARVAGAAGGALAWRPRWSPAVLGQLLRLSAPLGATTMLLALYASIPRYIVERQMGEQALGIFAAIAYVERAGTTVITAIGQSASPRLARCYAAGDLRAFRRLTLRLVGAAAALGGAGLLVALLGGEPILRLLYQPAYARGDVLLWVMASAGLWYIASLLGYAATAARIIRPQPAALALTLGVTLAACLRLVPAYGLAGAGAAMTLAGALAAALYLLMLRQYLFASPRPVPAA